MTEINDKSALPIEPTFKQENICRLCLDNGATLNIFNEDIILSMIENFCPLQIFESDGLPSTICQNCLNTLNLIEEFKRRCLDSDKILRGDIVNQEPEIQIFVKKEHDSDFGSDNDISTNDPVDEYDTKIVKTEKKVKKIKREPKGATNSKKPINKISKRKKNEIITLIVPPKTKSRLCPVCGKTFSSRTSLSGHISTHNTDKPFTCEVCSKSFRAKSQLQLHSTTHLTTREFSCESCGKTFKTKIDVNRHMRIVHKRLRKVSCEICGMEAATKDGLKSHMLIHTRVKNFECSICGMKFSYMHSLKQHERTHTGEKPYSCRFCDGKFSLHRTWKDHERLHTGETPYQCPSCPKAFAQLSNMKSHFRNNHREQDFDKLYTGLRRRKYDSH